MSDLFYLAVVIGIGGLIFIAAFKLLSRPDEQWMNDLLSDVRDLKDTPPMTISLSQSDLDLLNAGKPVTLVGPIIIIPPTACDHFQ